MANLEGDQSAQMPPMPPVQIQPGLSTTAGQFTALFTLVSLILAAVGYHYSASQIEGWAQAANNLATTIGPLLMIIPVLIGYINSRGKIQSNAIMAQAHIATGVPVGATTVEASSLMPLISKPRSSGNTLEAIPGIIGAAGSMTAPGGFKDPKTYGQILEVAKDLGVPGAAQADAVNQQLHPAELIVGILSLFHKKTKSVPTPGSSRGM